MALLNKRSRRPDARCLDARQLMPSQLEAPTASDLPSLGARLRRSNRVWTARAAEGQATMTEMTAMIASVENDISERRTMVMRRGTESGLETACGDGIFPEERWHVSTCS